MKRVLSLLIVIALTVTMVPQWSNVVEANTKKAKEKSKGESDVIVDNIDDFQSSHDYENDLDKTWIYRDENAGGFKITFSSECSVENGADYIFIYDENDKEIGKYTGTQLASQQLTIIGREIKVRLVSDASTTEYGFSIESFSTMNELIVDQLPDETTFLCGQPHDFAGIKIVGKFDNGDRSVVKSGYKIDDTVIDNTTVGEYTINVTFKGLSTSFVITYVEPDIVNLSISKQPNTTQFAQNAQCKLTGMVLKAEDELGNQYSVRSGWEVENYDSSTLELQTITIKYKNASVNLDIEIINLFKYTVSGSNVTITGINDSDIEDVVIPETIDGKTVTRINNNAFSGYSNIKAITVPNTVTSIGNAAFKGTSVEELTIPFIGLTKTSIYEEGVLGIIFGYTRTSSSSSTPSGTIAQYYSGSYKYCYYIPATLTEVNVTNAVSIQPYAFCACTGIKKIVLNNSITSLGIHSFDGCKNLESVNIPDSISSIPNYCFTDCSSLKKFSLNRVYTTIGIQAFYGCSSIETFEKLSLKEGITTISDKAFENCNQIKEIVLPKTVTNIGDRSFKVNGLEKLTIPFIGLTKTSSAETGVLGAIFGYARVSKDAATPSGTTAQYTGTYKYCYYIPSTLREVNVTNDTRVPSYGFCSCDKITQITMNNEISSFGTYSFYGCTGLENVNIPEGVSVIPNYCFTSCHSLKKINLNSSFTSIGNYAFYQCYSVESFEVLSIQNGLTTIGDRAFEGCNQIKEIELPNTISSIGDAAFKVNAVEKLTIPFVGLTKSATGETSVLGAIFGYARVSKDAAAPSGTTAQYTGTYKYCYYIPDSLKEVNVTGTNRIWAYGFNNCSKIEKVSLNNEIDSIGVSLFANCTSLKKANIPSSITALPENSFYNCVSISGVTLPSTLSSIGSNAFYGCSKIENFVDLEFNNGLQEIGGNAFYNCSQIKTIKLPNSVTKIGSFAFYGTKVEKITIPFVGLSRTATAYEGVLGAIFGYNWTSGSVPEGTTLQYTVSQKNYYYYIPSTLKEVEVTDASKLSHYAFNNCTNLTTIELNDEIATIYDHAFQNCSSLVSVNFPNSTKNVIDYCFSNCTSLGEIVLPDDTELISNSAFYNCSNLVSISIPATVTKIDANAFYGCSKVEGFVNLELNNGLQEIGGNAFYNCSQMKSIKLPNSVTKIGSFAFYGTKVEKITIPFVGLSRTATAYEGVLGAIFGYNWTSGAVPEGTTLQYTVSQKNYYYYIPSTLKEVEVTDASKLSNYSFNNCNNLTKIKLNKEITTISDYAFQNCRNIENLYLDDNITTIGTKIFNGCNSFIVYANKNTTAYDYSKNVGMTVYSTNSLSLNSYEFTLYGYGSRKIVPTVYMFNGKLDDDPAVQYRSLNNSVVTVDSSGTVSAVAPGNTTIVVECEGHTKTVDVTVYFKLQSISLNATSKDIDIGTTYQLSVSYNPSNTTDQKGVTWKSSNASVASVSDNGLVTAHKKGQAKITATSITGGYTASCNVNVLVPAVSISLNKSELILDKGVSETLSYAFEPAESTDTVSWSSTNTSVATVSSTGKVTAVKPGEAVIIATTNRGKTATCRVTVYSYIKTISFSKSERKVFVGKTVKLEPTITPSDYTDTLSWSSDNTSVVSVDNTGNITTKSISGTANITVTNNKGKSAKQKIIVTDTIQDNDVTLDSINCEYSPDGAKPNITVKVGDDILEENVDYTIEYSDNTELGSATVVIKNKKNENNSIRKEFNVVKHNIASDDIRVSLDQTDATYTGKEIVRQPTISLNGKALQRDVDYSFTCRNNVSVGNAIVTITGMGNYEGSINYTFKIVQCNLSRVYVKENIDKYYDGTVQMPQITLEYNGKTLVEGVDYTLPSISNKNVGSYTISLSGKGNFSGSKTIVYRIVQPDKKAYIVTLDKESWTYTGGWIEPKVTITFNNKDVTSQFSIHFNNNEDVGTASVSAYGYIGGKYSELTKTFKITPKPVKLRIDGVSSWYRYTGYNIEPDFECVLPNGYLADGTVTYLNNRNVGTATVAFKCTGNYSGTIKKSFSIIPSVNSTLTLYRFAKKKLSVKSSAKVSFKSSNKKVATVKSNGTVYGKKKGTCYVSVTSNGKTVRVKVTVKKVYLNKKKIKVYKGYSKKLKVKGYKKKVKWSSSNPRVAKVNKKGKVTGINPGKATITAKIGKTKLKCKVRVKKIAEVQLTDFGYIINYVNGVEPWFTFKNNTSKTIKYITTTLYAYNRVGDPAKCEITGVNHATLKFVGPIKKHKSRYYEKSAVIYNGTTGKIKIRKITVQFMDGTTKTYSMKRSA